MRSLRSLPGLPVLAAMSCVVVLVACTSDPTITEAPGTEPAGSTTGESDDLPTSMPDTTPGTTTPSTTSSTTTIASIEPSTSSTTAPPTSEDAARTEDPPAIDIAETSLVGAPFEGSPSGDVVVERLVETLGQPDRDSDWRPMPPKLTCTGNLDYRSVQWDDLRIVIERSSTENVSSFFGWSVGLANIALVPGELADWSESSGITTTSGVGIGDPARALQDADLPNLVRTERTTLRAIGSRVVTIETDADDEIVGFASGRTDCNGGDIGSVPCDRPVPVYLLPNGSLTGEVTVDEGAAIWGVEQIDDAEGSAVLVTQTLAGPDPVLAENARNGPNRASSGQVTVSAIPTGDPGVGGWTFYAFDERNDCVRVLFTSFPFDIAGAIEYADLLAVGFDPEI